MKFEFSAGGIVYKFEKNQTWILLCQHSYHHGWGFPKGLIGDSIKNEGKEATALREVEEETGARGEILRALNPITYWYQFENEKIKKTVYYYIMKYTGGDITKHDTEMENVEWVESKNVLSKLTFEADKKVFQEAIPIIQRLVTSV
jgi:8-oxo-dGTP pyrophosphatase MutT (NUDIX family)